MRKNVLISTTRQWNPGDEFIMMGVINILKEIYGDIYNPIIYNRNPDIRGGSRFRNQTRNYYQSYKWDCKSFKGKGILHEIFRIGHFDNSWKDDMKFENIDLAVFAGSPEWYGGRLKSMYEIIHKGKIPTLFLGLGAGSSLDFGKSKDIVNEVLDNALLITTRDKSTEVLLKKYDAKYVPCPALLSSPYSRQVKMLKKIGLIYATNETLKGNNVSKEMHDYIVKLYKDLSLEYDVSLVCHYIDEVDKARAELPNINIFYSYDSKDYIEIYNHFDLIIGGRVHGVGMGASLGIPGIMIKHDTRSSTTDGFLADSIEIGTSILELKKLINTISDNIYENSKKLIEHKEKVMDIYKNLILSNYKKNDDNI
ncbi:polysaccharide pyruvyl transferase family protein [Erysipelotrichaceae bacterium HCN-30851]